MMAHNKLRNLHGSQPLVWSEKLGYEAQKWCEELAMNGEIQHDGQAMNEKNEGENIGVVPKISQRSEGPDPCNTVVEKWYRKEETTTIKQDCLKLRECKSITLHRLVS